LSTGTELHTGRNDPEEILKPQGQLASYVLLVVLIPSQINNQNEHCMYGHGD